MLADKANLDKGVAEDSLDTPGHGCAAGNHLDDVGWAFA